jgi:hypothetical protein
MIDILDTLLTFWKYLIIPSFIVGMVGVFVIIGTRYSDEDNRKTKIIGRWLIAQLFFIAFTAFGISWTIEFLARNKIRDFLNNENSSVKINGVLLVIIESHKAILDLKTVSSKLVHHSSPVREDF